MSEKTFCINCFTDYNIKDFIKKNGKKVEDKNYKCDFCQSSQHCHHDKYDILDYHHKIRMKLISEDLYIIPQITFNKEIIKIINRHYEFIKEPKYNEAKTLTSLGSIITDLFQETSDILFRLSKHDFIQYKEFPFDETDYKIYTDSSKKDWVSQENSWLKWWKPKATFDWEEFKEHTKHKARFFDHNNSSFPLSEKLKPFCNHSAPL